MHTGCPSFPSSLYLFLKEPAPNPQSRGKAQLWEPDYTGPIHFLSWELKCKAMDNLRLGAPSMRPHPTGRQTEGSLAERRKEWQREGQRKGKGRERRDSRPLLQTSPVSKAQGTPTVGSWRTCRISNRQPWAWAPLSGLPFYAITAPLLLRHYKANCTFQSVVPKTPRTSTLFPTRLQNLHLTPGLRATRTSRFQTGKANDPKRDINQMSKVRVCRGRADNGVSDFLFPGAPTNT